MRSRIILSACIAGLCLLPARAQDYKFTALFILNFGKYVEWPASSAQGDFVITVLGDDPVMDELKVIAEKTKIGEQTLVIKKALSVDQVAQTHILYIAPDKSSLLPAVLARLGQSPTLVVTNKKGLAQEGAAINMVMVDGKQRYEINAEGIKKSGLAAKPVLFKLGKLIES